MVDPIACVQALYYVHVNIQAFLATCCCFPGKPQSKPLPINCLEGILQTRLVVQLSSNFKKDTCGTSVEGFPPSKKQKTETLRLFAKTSTATPQDQEATTHGKAKPRGDPKKTVWEPLWLKQVSGEKHRMISACFLCKNPEKSGVFNATGLLVKAKLSDVLISFDSRKNTVPKGSNDLHHVLVYFIGTNETTKQRADVFEKGILRQTKPPSCN